MHKMRHAESQDEVWEIKHMIEEAHRQRGREVRRVGNLRWDGVVRWGAGQGDAEGEDGISCKFSLGNSCAGDFCPLEVGICGLIDIL